MMQDHTNSTWGRVKEALRRDWEQTVHDLTRQKGQPNGQNVTRTVQQLLGRRPLSEPEDADATAEAFLRRTPVPDAAPADRQRP